MASLGMQTTAGSYALEGSIVLGDATAVSNLRSSGAIILGKANLAELSGLREELRRQWTGRGGSCFSAYVPGGDPFGSSCGNAVALSAGFAPACIAGDTTGSITFPASRAACYALRPTTGLVSTAGSLGQSPYLDTLGPMAKTTHDIAVLLSHMASECKKYPSSKLAAAGIFPYSEAPFPNRPLHSLAHQTVQTLKTIQLQPRPGMQSSRENGWAFQERRVLMSSTSGNDVGESRFPSCFAAGNSLGDLNELGTPKPKCPG